MANMTAANGSGLKLLVGVTGGIAAFKACGIVSRLVQDGYDVQVIMTESALRFLTPLTFAALTRKPVLTSLWDAPERIAHIALIREADALLIVPATAQTIAKLALGLADDLLTNAALAARIPLLIAPAMNSAMYEHSATQSHLRMLQDRGAHIIEPGVGFLAEREYGPGRLADEEHIYAALDDALADARSLAGRRVLITAGPTREPIDPVRYISNAASGATGIALAVTALARGATVRLILGPTTLSVPAGVEVLRVSTAAEMCAAATQADFQPDIIIASAAVADERPRAVSAHKHKKRDGGLRSIELEPTVDVVQNLRARFAAAFVVGFAAETQDHIANAHAKRVAKKLDAIITNDVSGGRGFGAQTNALTLLTATESYALAETTKALLAHHLWRLLMPLVRTAYESGFS